MNYIILWSFVQRACEAGVDNSMLKRVEYMYICVDFDGTIVDHRFPYIGDPVPLAIQWLKRWQELGAKLILFSMRSDGAKYGNVLSEAIAWLEERGVQLFAVNENPDQEEWSISPKAYAHIYIDDSAFGCPLVHPSGFARQCVDWSQVGPEVESRILAVKTGVRMS